MVSFQDVVNNRHDYAKEWKARTGGKVIGYFCTYTPEEIIYAAGMLPVRIIGSNEPSEVSESHIPSMYCPFCRDCLAQGLTGKYDYLDGIVLAKSCMHMMQAFWSWSLNIPIAFSHFIGMPAVLGSPRSKERLIDEFLRFKESLEQWTGKPITDKDLDRGIDTLNTNRKLLRQVYELRKPDTPLVSGAEAGAMVLSSMLSDKVEHSKWLEQVISEIPHRQSKIPAGARLMIVGSENHDLELYKIIEEKGANIVIDEFCMGSRYFWNQTPEQEDRLSAIAERYITRPRCPVKDVNERQRLAHIVNLAKEFNVRGALLVHQKFCTPHAFDLPHVRKALEENGIPTYALELDVTLHRGSVQTRTEAFLEMLEMEVA
ncbi:MAG: benzoyl-CoA reductase, bzd-type, N subunit [Dehalococcoidia bacterium]|nr:benzoyl-CoA reductase, bzd-type, N subunit [Dehalococcoidia bacterium]